MLAGDQLQETGNRLCRKILVAGRERSDREERQNRHHTGYEGATKGTKEGSTTKGRWDHRGPDHTFIAPTGSSKGTLG
jgi:hypothetical protein